MGELPINASGQTVVCDRNNFERLLIAAVSKTNADKSPASKKKKPEKPRSHSPFNDVVLRPERIPKKPQKRPEPTKEAQEVNIEDPKGILAVNSVITVLSHLENGTLKDISHDIQELLEQVTMGKVRFPRFEDDPKENILTKILDGDSPSRLKRFFRVNLDAFLDDLWDVIDTNEKRLREKKEIIQICNRLKEKGYDRERVDKELLDHFR